MVDLTFAAEHARDALSDCIEHGLVEDLFLAERILAVLDSIHLHGEEIDSKSYSEFFGFIREVLIRHLFIVLGKLYERKKSYPLRSVPAALAVLKDRGKELPVGQEPNFRAALIRAGMQAEAVDEAFSGADLTGRVVEFFERCLEDVSIERNLAITVRDKLIAHAERVQFDQVPQPTLDQCRVLLNLAHSFTAAIAWGYVDLCIEDMSGSRFLTGDAQRSSVCLERLLQSADVIPKPDYMQLLEKKSGDRSRI